MVSDITSEIDAQRRYYAETAHQYDTLHVNEGNEHFFALCVMLGAIDFLGARSVLDIGSGTGRVLVSTEQRDGDDEGDEAVVVHAGSGALLARLVGKEHCRTRMRS